MVVMHYIKWLLLFHILSGQVAFLHPCRMSACCCVSGDAVMQVAQCWYKQEYYCAGAKCGGFLFHFFSFGISEHVRLAPFNSVILGQPSLPFRFMYWDGAVLWPCVWFLKTLRVGKCAVEWCGIIRYCITTHTTYTYIMTVKEIIDCCSAIFYYLLVLNWWLLCILELRSKARELFLRKYFVQKAQYVFLFLDWKMRRKILCVQMDPSIVWFGTIWFKTSRLQLDSLVVVFLPFCADFPPLPAPSVRISGNGRVRAKA